MLIRINFLIINFIGHSPNMMNDFLVNYKLFSFKHRVFYSLLTFVNNIIITENSPKSLCDIFRTTAARHRSYNLKNKNELDTTKSKSRFGDMTFAHFFPKLIKCY